MNIEILNVNN